VAVTPEPGTDLVLPRAARMSAQIKRGLTVAYVAAPANQSTPRPDLDQLQILAAEVGGVWADLSGDDPARVLVQLAWDQHITQIVVGPSHRSYWQKLRSGRSTLDKIISLAAAANIDVHIVSRPDDALRESPDDHNVTAGGERSPASADAPPTGDGSAS
jgi:two-component system, OmpR family, sensor histidine kinase KdpD